MLFVGKRLAGGVAGFDGALVVADKAAGGGIGAVAALQVPLGGGGGVGVAGADDAGIGAIAGAALVVPSHQPACVHPGAPALLICASLNCS